MNAPRSRQSHQFSQDRPQILAPRSDFDPQQLFDRMMPGDFVGQRRDVIHPVDNRDVLIEVQMLAQLFEAGMQIADVRNRIDNRLAIQRQNQPQRGMGRRMLRAEIQRPEILLFGSIHFSKIGNVKRHWKPRIGERQFCRSGTESRVGGQKRGVSCPLGSQSGSYGVRRAPSAGNLFAADEP